MGALRHRHRRRRRLCPRQHPVVGQGRGRLRDRTRPQPQAVPVRRGARGPQARQDAGLGPRHVGGHRHRLPALLDPRAGPAGQRHPDRLRRQRDLRRAGPRHVRRHGRQPPGPQLRLLPRRHGRGGQRGRVQPNPPRRHHRGRQLEGACPQHRAAALQPRGGHLHPHLRPAVLAHAAVGPRGRRPAQPAADPEHHRLPRDDPAHARRGPGPGRGGDPPRARTARGRGHRLRRPEGG